MVCRGMDSIILVHDRDQWRALTLLCNEISGFKTTGYS
jgi:hypothetical protein